MTTDNMQKKCGFCGESIPARAGRCPYCGSILEVTIDNHYGFPGEMTPLNPDDGTNGPTPDPAAQNPYDQMSPAQNPNDPVPPVPNPNDRIPPVQNPGNRIPQAQPPVDRTGEGNPYNGYSGNPSQPVSYSGMRPDETEQMHNAYRSYGNGSFKTNYNYSSGPREPLSNGMKVFLTMIVALIPGFGQLAGLIAAIVFMNSDGDNDRKSFGVALLVASLILFVLSCIGCFILILASNQMSDFKY